MYNDIVLTALQGITLPKDELRISQIVSDSLTQAGHPNILCLGIFNGSESLFEGTIMDGLNMNTGPILRFTYDWDTDEFTEL
jgi:hypothetical protein